MFQSYFNCKVFDGDLLRVVKDFRAVSPAVAIVIHREMSDLVQEALKHLSKVVVLELPVQPNVIHFLAEKVVRGMTLYT